MSQLNDQIDASVTEPLASPADEGSSDLSAAGSSGSLPDAPAPPNPEGPLNGAPAIHDVGRGAVVELDSGVGDQVQIMVNNMLIARGEIVVVNDRIAVEITEVVRRERE
jgi:hypothetical protein